MLLAISARSDKVDFPELVERKANVAFAELVETPQVIRQQQPFPRLVSPSASTTAAAPAHWAQALAVFRQATETYARMLEISRSARAMRVPAAIPRPRIDAAPARAGTAKTCDLAALTPRERQVAALLADGRTNQEIAELLVIERGTAANHVAHILRKLGVSNRTQVAVLVRPYPGGA
jgi:DNA-binding NarL/FixJ family response regulator